MSEDTYQNLHWCNPDDSDEYDDSDDHDEMKVF